MAFPLVRELLVFPMNMKRGNVLESPADTRSATVDGGNMRAEWAIAIAAVDGLFGSILAIGSHVEVNAYSSYLYGLV